MPRKREGWKSHFGVKKKTRKNQTHNNNYY